jgi:hypothetical protein
MYTTLAALKTYLAITTAGDDALLTDLIGRAGAIIDAYCGRTFEAAVDSTRTFDALRDVSSDGRTLYISPDLAQVTSVTNAGATVSPTLYIAEPRTPPYYGLRLKRSSGRSWTWTTDAEDAISITGRWAYSVSAPPDVQQACIRVASYLYRQRDTAGEIDRPLVTPDGHTLLPGRLPEDVVLMLDPYRRRVR